MMSIQEVAKVTGLTSRTLRLYEEIGILGADKRNQAGVRHYSSESISRLRRIVAMKATGITLKDLSTLLGNEDGTSTRRVFETRMAKIDAQIAELSAKRTALESVMAMDGTLGDLDVETRLALSPGERLKLFALEQLENSTHGNAYLAEEFAALSTVPEAYGLILAAKKIMNFAHANKILTNGARGSASGSLLLHLVGFSTVEPVVWELQPARVWGNGTKALHLDVSYAHGKPLVELCEELSASFKPWRIEAFRLPILDIFAAVEARVGAIDYEAISDDSEEVLTPFRTGDCEKILWFDEPACTLAAKLYPEQLPGWEGYERMNEYLRGQDIVNFRDVLNLFALRRPKSQAFVARMHEYVERKHRGEPMTIYHEEIVAKLRSCLPCDGLQANKLRVRAAKNKLTEADCTFIREHGGEETLEYLRQEAPYSFCKAHVASHSRLVKRCAILKTRHRAAYFDEIARWEDKNGLSWGDFGFRTDEVCLLK